MQTNYILHRRADLKQIKISEIDFQLPDLKNTEESKALVISRWMMNWIDEDLKLGKIRISDLLPQKSELAYFLGVSVGTIQNALRYIEDLGYVESKQRIGTIIRDRSSECPNLRKHTSKREIAITEIKKFILKNKLKPGRQLPSSRTLSTLIGCSSNTTRLALEYLCSVDIVARLPKKSKDSGWIVKSVDFERKGFATSGKTLVKKVENDLKDFIDSNLRVGDRMPPHSELSGYLKVSIKTIHDALKNLIAEGILIARRGRYGTTVIKLPSHMNKETEKLELSIFAPAKETAFYYYEKTQNAIRKMIADQYEIGSKLPSIMELSKEMDLSPNTIRKAFHNLAKEGYLVFSRGRYGGTFVADIPQSDVEAFKWLAVNPQYAEMYSKQ